MTVHSLSINERAILYVTRKFNFRQTHFRFPPSYLWVDTPGPPVFDSSPVFSEYVCKSRIYFWWICHLFLLGKHNGLYDWRHTLLYRMICFFTIQRAFSGNAGMLMYVYKRQYVRYNTKCIANKPSCGVWWTLEDLPWPKSAGPHHQERRHFAWHLKKDSW